MNNGNRFWRYDNLANTFLCSFGITLFFLSSICIAQEDLGWFRTENLVDCIGPFDSWGVSWYMSEYDDSDWISVTLPNTGWGCDNCDRFYRRWFVVDPDTTLYLTLYSDDGLTLYVNGDSIGHWGGNCHQGGTVGGYGISLAPFLQDGSNLVAVHVSEAGGAENFDAVETRSYGRTPRQAAQKGLDYLMGEAVAWQNANNCYGCHVQTFAIIGGAIGKRNDYSVSDDTLSILIEGMIDLVRGRDTDGCFSRTEPNYKNVTTQFAVWALAEYDRWVDVTYQDTLIQATECLMGRRTGGGLYLDHAENPVDQSHIMATANMMNGLSRSYDVTADPSFQTALAEGETWIRDNTPSTTQDYAFEILGLRLAGVSANDSLIQWCVEQLRLRQSSDGGWGFTGGWGSYPYGTGEAIYALRSADISSQDSSIQEGVEFLLMRQHPDGSWGAENWPGGRPSAFASTMWGVLGLLDLIPPITVEIQSPSDGERFDHGDTIEVLANALDNVGSPISYGEIYLDELLQISLPGDYYQHNLFTETLNEGFHRIRVEAYNEAGQSSSTQVSFILGQVLLTDPSVDPNPFSPNGDGINDSTLISFRVTVSPGHEAWVKIDIVDTSQTIIRELQPPVPTGAGVQHSWWNGHDDGGFVVDDGFYQAVITAHDSLSSLDDTLVENIIAVIPEQNAAGVTGRVVDPEASPIPHVLVTAISAGGQTHGISRTTSSGIYLITTLLGDSTYTLVFAREGFCQDSLHDVSVPSGSIEELPDFTLYPIGLCCNYVRGDANGVGGANGLDVIYMVNYLKGEGPAPPDSCDCPPHDWIYAAADANGSCWFNGIDVIYLVNYLKGEGPPPAYCEDCPPVEL